MPAESALPTLPALDRRAFIASLGGTAVVAAMSPEAKADALEDGLTQAAAPKKKLPKVADLEAQIATRHYRRGAGNLFAAPTGTVPRLAPMPAKATLVDFIKLRFMGTANHCLQSAAKARASGMADDIVFACLIHDLPMAMMRSHHGFWSAQLFEPYVAEKVTFAVRHHASLRFFPDEQAGYYYPELYREMFGEDYVPPPYVQQEYAMVSKHRWYMAPRQVTVNDLYAFDPNAKVSLDDFVDTIGRHFKQPKEGLGLDNSRTAHMWRTIADPDSPL